jgi:predicted NBD/HSP70 family sugar kinase
MYLLIDVGGTKTLIAIANQSGKVLHSLKFPTITDQKLFSKNLVQQIRSNFALSNVEAIGVAMPGIVKKNVAVELGNLPWKNFDLAKLLKEEFGINAYIENDANLAALSEAPKQTGRSVYLTFSTGIGGGVIDDGKLAAHHKNFEPGHDIYELNGESAEWEDLASAKTFHDKYKKDFQEITDEAFWEKEVPEAIAVGLIPTIKSLKPDRIIFGGPLGFELNRYRAPLRKILKSKLGKTTLPRLFVAKYGNFSVIQGCYLYAKAKNSHK